jgi:predicted MFS family arabinose efflux permease
VTDRAPGVASAPVPDVALPAGAVLALSVAAFASGISLRVTDAMLPGLARDFGLSLGEASSVITVFALAYGLSQLVFGPLGDRFGKYRVIAWGCLACGVTTLSCAFAPGFSVLLFTRTAAGATAASIIPLAMAWIGDVISYERRQPVLARFLIGQILGISAGVMVGGYAMEHWSWRTPFYGIAVVFFAIACVLLFIDKRLPPRARQTRRSQGHALRHMLHEFAQVLALPWARLVLGVVFFEGAFLYGSFAFIASHLHAVHGLPLSQAGQVVMLFGGGGFVYAMGSRYLVHRLGESGLCLVGGVLVSTAYLVVAHSAQWWTAMPACAMAGLGFYMLHNTLQINATQMAPERRGAAVAAFASCFFIGQSAGVGVNGLLISSMGTRGVITLGAFGVLLVATLFSRRKALQRQR